MYRTVDFSIVENEIKKSIEEMPCYEDPIDQIELQEKINKALERIKEQSVEWFAPAGSGFFPGIKPFEFKQEFFEVFRVSRDGSEFLEETQRAKELVPNIQRYVEDDYDLFVINLEDKSFYKASEFFCMNKINKFWTKKENENE